MSKSILPPHPSRIILINPTRYLGNLLIAGKLIQEFAAYCARQGISFRIVIDEAFQPLLEGALPASSLICYPRRRINQASPLKKALIYMRCLREIRSFNADIAFSIEEDSVSKRLTQFSGARFKLGCSSTGPAFGYDQTIVLDFGTRPVERQHRWYSFQDVFAELGLPVSHPAYLELPRRELPTALYDKLKAAGIELDKQQIVLHAGATKEYKKWPLHYFAELCEKLRQPGRQIVFIGAGKDAREIAEVLKLVKTPLTGIVNLCDKLSLAELAEYFRQVSAIVGNDSGPFHLAAAQGVPGFVIFGPTRVDLWGPLSESSSVISGHMLCGIECKRGQCPYQYRCLSSLTPDTVLTRLRPLLMQPVV